MVIDGRPWSLAVDCGYSWSTVVEHYILRFLIEQMVSTNLSMYDVIFHLYSLKITLFHTQTI